MTHAPYAGGARPGGARRGAVHGALEACESALAEHLQAVALAFGGAGLGLVDLPSLGSETVVPAQVRLAGVLYWCREADAAGLPSFVEALAARLAAGALALPLCASAHRLARLHRGRAHRFAEPERRALYARLFDGPRGASEPGFEAALRDFCVTAAMVGRRRRDEGTLDLQARMGVLARDLAQALSERATGIAGFAARDIVQQIREALAILREPDLATALGGGPEAAIIARHAPSVLGRPVNVRACLDRAAAGFEVIAFIAGAGAARGTPAVGPGHPIVGAAERWLAAREVVS